MKYKVDQIQGIVDSLSSIYDVVRLVDPAKHKMITFDEDENVIYDQYECYQVWQKTARCKNCVSINAIHNNSRMTKFEFIEDDVYHVVSKPIRIECKTGSEVICTLEIVSKITDEILFGAFGKQELAKKIINSEKKIFTDSLTQVYNRRYFDERAFCHNDRCDLDRDVIFIMVDLNKFKSVNDNYGHDLGDWVLKETARVIKASVRTTDSVIRLGGDEFLIVLSNCQLPVAERIVETIARRLERDVVYDKEKNLYAMANFGIAVAEKFYDNVKFINELLKEADINMYKNKKISDEEELANV
jgi:diguanylate cyclase (GGDEF)-like protein